jgi:hypothetical protein
MEVEERAAEVDTSLLLSEYEGTISRDEDQINMATWESGIAFASSCGLGCIWIVLCH